MDSEKENVSNATEVKNKPTRDLYILMELLNPVVNENYIISANTISMAKKRGKDLLEKIKITNEIGIFGVLVQ